MNHEAQLRLQAYLDGELSVSEAAVVETWLAREPAAQLLLAELRQTKALLHDGEPEKSVPETREFYWAQIERRLHPATSSKVRPTLAAVFSGAKKWLVPVAATLLAVWLIRPPSRAVSAPSEDVNTALSATSCITFHSAAEGLTIVWVDTSGN